MNTFIPGFFSPWIAYAVITLLHYVLPGKWIKGYVKDDKTGESLNYRLNGIFVLALSILLWAVLGLLKWVPFDYLYQVRWPSLLGAIVLGLLFSFLIVLPHPSTGLGYRLFLCAVPFRVGSGPGREYAEILL
jgi:hypothetical protein